MSRFSKQLQLHKIQVKPSWDDWNLDEKFLNSLSRFNEKHPERKLNSILDGIRQALEDGKDILDLIPDSPFPAGSLVKSLACLIKLGITVTRAKQTVYEFAMQVVEWVDLVKSAFEGDDRDHFNWTTWRSLRKTRNLVQEICLWAHTRLEDRRWLRIENGFRIGKEIDEFKARLTEAKELFRDLSLLHLTGGINALRATFKSIVFRQDEILIEIRKVKQEQKAQLAYIICEIEDMKLAQVRKAFLKENLGGHIVSKPGYDTQGKNPCDAGTRENEVKDIMEWLNSISPGSQNFLWLTGDPGCGKSAITATLAAHCKEEGVLWAQFFINRNNLETTDPNSFFPSIARQLAIFSPDVERAIHDRLIVKPTLADRMTSEQAGSLFIDALAVAAKLDRGKVVAVIIDGLDETQRTRLYETAEIFSRLFSALTQYPNVKVFVSSRTEDDIRRPFAPRLSEANVKRVHLDTQSSTGDVAMYLRRQLEEIVDRHDLKWDEWPREDRMELLGVRASGLFIWAVTAVRFLQARINISGRSCLNDVLDELTGKALEGINSLYSYILISTYNTHVTDRDFEGFRRIIGTIVLLREPLCVDDLSGLLDFHERPSNTQIDVVNFVRVLRTVLVYGTEAVDGRTVPRLHKSFVEFITNKELFRELSLDLRLCVDAVEAEGQLALCCLRQFADICKNRGKSSGNMHLEYASRFCFSHAQAMTKRDSRPLALVILDPKTTVGDIQIRFSTVRQSGHVIPWFPFDSSGSPPKPFSPLTAAYKVETGRELTSRILATASKKVWSVAYSPNGDQIVSGLYDGTISMWDVRTGKEMRKFKGHSKGVFTVAFSPSGTRFASGSDDHTVIIWDSRTLEEKNVLRGHSDKIRTVAFSPGEEVLASGSWDKTVKLWNVHSGESIASLKHDVAVISVVFTTDGCQVIAGCWDGRVCFWDRRTFERGQTLTSSNSSVDSISISPFEHRFLAIGDGGLCLWNKTDSGFVLDDKLSFKLGKSNNPFQASFSPDGKLALVSNPSQSDNCPSGLFVYDLHSRVKFPIINNKRKTDTIALSPDGSFVVFHYLDDKEIHVVDVPRLHPVTLTALSPNGDMAACVFSDGSLWLGSPGDLPIASKQLSREGEVGNLKHLTFSSDNSLLAAIDDESIYLWDLSALNLRGRASHNNLSCTTSLSFLADHTLTSSHEDRNLLAWSIVDGNLRPRCIDSPASDLVFEPTLLLNVDDQAQVHDVAGARWFPEKENGTGIWAYADDCLIRARVDGTVTLLPLNIP